MLLLVVELEAQVILEQEVVAVEHKVFLLQQAVQVEAEVAVMLELLLAALVETGL
jgi:hypothetical protein